MLDKNIIKLLEEKSGKPLNSSSACERLVLDIETETGEKLGFTTLKRLLGFTFERAEPRQSTLDILARYLGFISYKELEDVIKNIGDSNFDSNAESIISSRLPANAKINLSYYPNRSLTLQHITNDKFIVMESVNGSLKSGDIIFVDSFTDGLPLMVKNVIRFGESLGSYMAGKKLGIKIES